jgi:hypothetical protein
VPSLRRPPGHCGCRRGWMGQPRGYRPRSPSVRPEGRARRHPQRSPFSRPISLSGVYPPPGVFARLRSISTGGPIGVSGRVDQAGVNSARKRNGESENSRGTSERGGRERQRSWLKLESCKGNGESERMCRRAQVGVDTPETTKPRGDDPMGFCANK